MLFLEDLLEGGHVPVVAIPEEVDAVAPFSTVADLERVDVREAKDYHLKVWSTVGRRKWSRSDDARRRGSDM